MNISWGTKLLLVFILFAGGIGYMVYRCVNIPVDLVSKEYYKDELAYQEVIDGTKQANALTGNVTFSKNGNVVTLQLPAEMKNQLVKGSIFFYCPSKAGNDKKIALATTADATQTIAASQLAAGSYVVKVTWQANNKQYYHEQAIKL